MWISRKRWNEMQRRVTNLENRQKVQREEINSQIINMAKRILRQPEELSKELESVESIEKFVDEFIHS